jgi:hypothetical protein
MSALSEDTEENERSNVDNTESSLHTNTIRTPQTTPTSTSLHSLVSPTPL